MNAKLSQGYTEKPYLHICENCYHRVQTFPSPLYEPYQKCNIGDFPVKLTASCRHFMRKT